MKKYRLYLGDEKRVKSKKKKQSGLGLRKLPNLICEAALKEDGGNRNIFLIFFFFKTNKAYRVKHSVVH